MAKPNSALINNLSSVFVQPDGANTRAFYTDCKTLEEISAALGSRELIQCFDKYGNYITVGTTQSAPEMITFTIEGMLVREQDMLESLKGCTFAIYVPMRDCGDKTDLNNYVRLVRLGDVKVINTTYAGLVSRDEQAMHMYNVECDATPPVSVHNVLKNLRMTTSGTYAQNSVLVNRDTQCSPNCDETYKAGQKVWIIGDGAVAADAELFKSTDFGVTYAAPSGGSPFGNDEALQAQTRFGIGNGTYRWLVALAAPSGAQGKVAYSDDDGANWTVVNLGGATAGHGPTHPEGIFALDRYNIWLAGAGGYIYKSADGGETWTAQESGVITTGAYTSVHFFDDQYGVAVAAADVIAVTSNGGDSWAAATATGGSNGLLTVKRVTRTKMWVGDDGGELYYTSNSGTTWTQRTGWAGSGAGDVQSMDWLNEYTGFMVHNSAAPVGTVLKTVDGGDTWSALTTPTNAGLNHIAAVDENTAYVVGEAQSSAPVVLKISAV